MWTKAGIGILVVVVGLGTILAGGVGAVSSVAESRPLADAGLDQTTTEGSTVYLDAGGSTAPDGRITEYKWRIETPAGKTLQPKCSTCITTSFVANTTGTYEVTVSVTDNTNQTDSDTLHVEVEAYKPPELSVSGPSEVVVGETATYTAEATATEEPLSSLLWRHDGAHHDDASFSGSRSIHEETTLTFTEPGVYPVNATVADELGYQASDGMTVRVTKPKPHFTVDITNIDTPVPAGDSLTVTTNIENVGDGAATQNVSLMRDGTPVNSTVVSLASETEETVEFRWKTTSGDVGTHEFVARTANDSDSQEASVESLAGAQVCSKKIDCAFMFSELDANVYVDGEQMKTEIALEAPGDVNLENIAIAPEEHNVEFVAEDGTVYDVRDDGTIPVGPNQINNGQVKVELEHSKGKTVGPSWYGAERGQKKKAEAEINNPTFTRNRKKITTPGISEDTALKSQDHVYKKSPHSLRSLEVSVNRSSGRAY
ncbi:PKD domain-containing protein [Halovenus rubra]|uniref:PKD domain-containing protein n=2 Tax=Halovenus rubra TaxID=869890 RepID=A0ABD5X7K7_9EURY|nr:PKD domain-containing protein [Halovenus rubra]